MHVGVVLINWNGADDTIACLESLRSATPPPPCVVVVENASADDSLERLRAWARTSGTGTAEVTEDELLDPTVARPWLVIARLATHRGFSGGNNTGIRLLRALPDVSHYLLLNNDTEVAPDYFEALADALRQAPDAGLISGTIFEHGDRSRVWYAGGSAIDWRAMVVHDLEVPADEHPRPTEFITGCALVIARHTVEAIGLLPEAVYFPIYVEDAEYSLRARRAGLPVLYAPRPVVYHKVGGTTGGVELSARAMYLYQKHRALYVRRNFRGGLRGVALAYLVLTKPPRAMLELARGRPRIAMAILRGAVAGLFSRAAAR